MNVNCPSCFYRWVWDSAAQLHAMTGKPIEECFTSALLLRTTQKIAGLVEGDPDPTVDEAVARAFKRAVKPALKQTGMDAKDPDVVAMIAGVLNLFPVYGFKGREYLGMAGPREYLEAGAPNDLDDRRLERLARVRCGVGEPNGPLH